MDEVARKGSIHAIEAIPEDVRRVFVTAHDVASEWHIRMQAAFQKYTDNAVSKTVNLPRDATVGGRAQGLRSGLPAELQGRHDLPRRQQGKPGPLLRPEERGGRAADGGRARPPRDPGRLHHQDQDRLRPPLRHGDRIRGQALRGLCHHREVRALHHRQDRGHRAARVARAAGRGHRGQDRGPAQGHRRGAPHLPGRGAGSVDPRRDLARAGEALPGRRERRPVTARPSTACWGRNARSAGRW